jgi:hypothetical protein
METTDEIHNKSAPLMKKTYCIVGSPNVLKRFDDFLAYVQHCTDTGRFKTIAFDIDGDGSEHFRVLGELPKVEEDRVQKHRHGFDMFLS